ncbi:MAG: acyl-CoA dehydrogenase family protein [Candidatus Nanopelagicales bacterium]|jgi:alkylation response protein AidB-like acyl-CoA dehydrogenase
MTPPVASHEGTRAHTGAGRPTRLNEREQNDIVQIVRDLGPAMRERAVDIDKNAVFPFDNFDDFRRTGLLAVCVPKEYGGMGASFADYARVSAEIGRYCGSTALTFNMHNATMLWAGEVSDLLDMTPEERETHERRRAEMFRGVVEDGEIHSQPFSEGLNPGALAGVATKAEPVEGGYRVTGRKIFASLSGAAHRYNVTCQVPGEEFLRLLSVRSNAEGVEIVDDWDPLGMRGTVSRTLLLKDVFVPFDDEIMPGGMYDQAANRYPYLFMSLAPSYLGLTRGILDFTREYLRGEMPGAAKGTGRRDNPIKQMGWAEMQIKYEQSKAMLYSVLDMAFLDPDEDMMVSAWSAVNVVMENANEVARTAVRVCGGQSMLKHLALERMYRDSRLGSTMLPWSGEVTLERIGKARLYD